MRFTTFLVPAEPSRILALTSAYANRPGTSEARPLSLLAFLSNGPRHVWVELLQHVQHALTRPIRQAAWPGTWRPYQAAISVQVRNEGCDSTSSVAAAA